MTMRKGLAGLCLLLLVRNGLALDVISGEIHAECISGNSYSFHTAIWTNGQPQAPDSVFWDYGDGILAALPFSAASSCVQYGNSGLYLTRWQTTHTYLGPSPPGGYQLYAELGNRETGLDNIPNSANTIMVLSLNIVADPFIGCNDLPSFALFNAADTAFQLQANSFDAQASDPENDSLAFTLEPCADTGNLTGYLFPMGLTINDTSGIYSWNFPQQPGKFNVVIRGTQWKRIQNNWVVQAGYFSREIRIHTGFANSMAENTVPEISLYPVPAMTGQEIKAGLPGNAEEKLRLFDVQGNLVSEIYVQSADTSSVLLPLLPAGIYFVEFSYSNRKPVCKKLVILPAANQ